MSPRTVLLVEDDADVRDSFRESLVEGGLHVVTAEDGRVALEHLLRDDLPDVIVLDLKLPHRSGWDLLDTLRASATFVQVPVVVVSAFLGMPPAGAVAWLRKPVRPGELLATVQRHLQGRRLERDVD